MLLAIDLIFEEASSRFLDAEIDRRTAKGLPAKPPAIEAQSGEASRVGSSPGPASRDFRTVGSQLDEGPFGPTCRFSYCKSTGLTIMFTASTYRQNVSICQTRTDTLPRHAL